MSKKLKELTIRDNFMFAAVMLYNDNCKEFLEMVLQIEIDRLEVSHEKNLVYHPDYRGVRLDVFAKDEFGTHYNIEMQVAKDNLPKRTRYYHSQIDMEMLEKGVGYDKLSNSYVIFICNFDPFGKKKYRYTINQIIEELPEIIFDDGSHTIILSTKGKNEDEIPKGLVQFLDFVEKDNENQDMSTSSPYVKRLQETIKQIKDSREMGKQYMKFEEMLDYREMDVLKKLIFKYLQKNSIGIPDYLKDKISEIYNIDILTKMLDYAVESSNLQEFLERSNLE